MHRLKQPTSFYRLAHLATSTGKAEDHQIAQTGAPLCIHGHTIILPLLADFPNPRIDINPYTDNCEFLADYDWSKRVIDIDNVLSCARKSHRCNLVVIALDSFTIGNIKPIRLEDVDLQKVLLVGDTQHGPAQGFIELIELARSGHFSKIISANNPQHLNLFRAYGVPKSKLFYCPLGVSNLPPWIDKIKYEEFIFPARVATSLSRQPSFVGSLTDHHPSRRKLINHLSKMGLTRVVKTQSFKEASYYHNQSLASINVSLNSDINFRFGEVLVSGGVLVTDQLPAIQSDYISKFFGSDGVHYFKGLQEVQTLLASLQREERLPNILESRHLDTPFVSLWNQGKLLRTIDDLEDYLIGYSDDWRESAEKQIFKDYPDSIKTKDTWDRVLRYVEIRDFCRSQNSSLSPKRLIVHDEMCPLTLLDAADLQFDEIELRTARSVIRFVVDVISRNEPNYFAVKI